jgi:hypothetical protein
VYQLSATLGGSLGCINDFKDMHPVRYTGNMVDIPPHAVDLDMKYICLEQTELFLLIKVLKNELP